jgi:acyl transferase domain-containing protein/NADPH:quinone reductase-like Zn-dependent oxidoreductase/acyl carrier protein
VTQNASSQASLQTAEGIQSWLVSHLGERLGIDPRTIDIRERFSRYGLDSQGVTGLLADLAQALCRPLSPLLAWEHPTPESLARHLTSGAVGARPSRGSHGKERSPATGFSRGSSPVAIIGMACRFPKAPDPEAFWRLLRDGVDAITRVPEDRWDADALYDAELGAPGKANARGGGFLDHIDQFDAQFFGISPREAAQMDPQQRLMLELSWEALEDAGLTADRLSGTETGVFCGVIWSDYAALLHRDGVESISQHTVTGYHGSIIANRVSYVLGLQGPSLTIDSACSSALVSIHMACASLRSGESTLALAGGVNLNIIPESMVGVSKFGGLSPDSRCFTFDARANGYARGEGGGVVVLKLLSQAIIDGDPIVCVIRGSAVNNDGASNSLTAPNPLAQEALLRAAYARAGVDPGEVQYVEAHGTGTQLGDPIEARALGAVFSPGRALESPLLVGSAKTNIGHLEGAAGIAGLIKVALCIKHRQIAPSLHFETPNPLIPFDELRLRVQRSLGDFPGMDRPIVAGVSAFGLGGTNSHVVLQEWQPPRAEAFLLSAESSEALLSRGRELLESVARSSERQAPLSILAGAVAAGARHGAYRAAITARSHAELERRLQGFLQGSVLAGVSVGRREPGAPPKVAFVFAGQGAQWFGMGRSLLQQEPVFRATLEQCDHFIRQNLGWSLLDELTAERESSRLDEIDVSLPAIISLEIATAALWRAWGIEPAAVVGHSTGEIAAAQVAGVLSIEDAMRTICAYGQLIRRHRGRGAMGVVALPWDEAKKALAGYEGRVFAAIQHSVDSTVLAGAPDALEAVFEALTRKSVFCRLVDMDVAPHCPLVDELRGELHEVLRDVRPRPGTVPIVSEVPGAVLDGERFDAAHWVRNFGDPAFFSTAVDHLVEEGFSVFLEVSPHPAAKHGIETNLRRAGRQGRVLASLRRGEDEREVLLDSLGALDTLGVPVRWEEVYPPPAKPVEPLAASALADAPVSPFAAGRAPVHLHLHLHLLPLSAREPRALADLARSYQRLLAAEPADAPVSLADIAYSASVRRSHHPHRLSVVGSSREEIHEALGAFLRGEAHAGMAQGQASLGPRPRLVFVFPGQGSQWVGMGRSLLAEEPVFRATIEACAEAIQREAGWSLLDELGAEASPSRIEPIDVLQPTLFAIEVALAALWRSWGVEPDAVVGHSMGEVAAAHVAGALGLEDAVRIICRRSRLLRRVSGQGAMALVELTMAQAEQALAGYEDRLSIAVTSGPRSTVLSGAPGALEEVLARLDQQQVFWRRVKVDVASHSPQVDPLLGELGELLGGLTPAVAKVPMFSTVTGRPCEGTELGAEYWKQNLRAPVLFSQTLDRMIEGGHTLFVEMSPHPILLPSIEEALRHRERRGVAVPSLRREQEERRALLSSLGALYAHGHALEWKRLYPSGGRSVPLPLYPWQRERYWVETETEAAAATKEAERASSASMRHGAPRSAAASHPLLGAAFTVATQPAARFWEQALCRKALPYVADHRVQGTVVLPGAAYLEMALAAAQEAYGKGSLVLSRVVFEQMLLLPAEGGPTVQVLLDEQGAFQVSSLEGDTWVKHAAGDLRLTASAPDEQESREPHEAPGAIQKRCRASVSGAQHYRSMAERGLDYGPCFQGVEELWIGDSEALGRVRLPAAVAPQAGVYRFHPALLDACLQVMGGLFSKGDETYVPVALEKMRMQRPPGGAGLWVHARRRPEDGHGPALLTGDLTLLDDGGQPVAELQGLRLQRVGDGAPRDLARFEGWLYELTWRRKERPARAPAAPARGTGDDRWLVFTDSRGVGQALSDQLAARGERCVLVAAATADAPPPGSRSVAPARAEDVDRLLAEVFEGGAVRCRGIVFLWALEAPPFDATSLASLSASRELAGTAVVLLIQAIARAGFRDPPRLWLVTRGAQAVGAAMEAVSVAQAPLWGLGAAVVHEHPELRCALVDLDLDLALEPAPGAIDALVEELVADGDEDRIALRREGRYVARLVRRAPRAGGEVEPVAMAPAGERPFCLESARPGTLESLVLREVSRRPPGPGEVEVQVRAAGLNFLDVLRALAAIPDDDPGSAGPTLRLGDECAGTIVAVGEGVTELAVGDDVVAIAGGSFGAFVTTSSLLTALKPAHLTFEEAATIPVAFLTAHHALHHVGRMARGERVLIHAAAGGVGLSAVQLAQRAGAEIFATAGSPEKRAFLRELGVQHVMDSRSLAFADEVMELTGGQGVDLVLNSLSGPFIPASFALLRGHGRFVELGKRDYYEDRKLGLRPFLKNLSYSLVDLRSMFQQRPLAVQALLRQVRSGFEAKDLQPIPHRSFPIARVADAFHVMAKAEHTGKLVVVLEGKETAPIAPSSTGLASFRADATYLVTGGLGGIGLMLARWLVERGARHLVLVGRSGASAAATEAISSLESLGAEVRVAKADVAQEPQIGEVFRTIDQAMPPLAGVFHGAAVLEDSTLLRQTPERFRAVMAAKVDGAWNLHALCRGRALDCFVLFSSAASVLGSPGQANYCAANAFLDALAHQRRAMGLPAVSINWGAWAEVGLAAADASRGERLAARGMAGMAPTQALAALGEVLKSALVQVAVMPFDLRQWSQFYPRATGSPLFAELSRELPGEARKSGADDLRQALLGAPIGERLPLLEAHLQEQVARVLRMATSRVDRGTPLRSLGLDSLMAIELRNRLEDSLGLTLPSTLVWAYPTMAELGPELGARMQIPLTAAAEPAVAASNGGSVSAAARSPSSPESDEALELEVKVKVKVEVEVEMEALSQDALAAALAEELAEIERERAR